MSGEEIPGQRPIHPDKGSRSGRAQAEKRLIAADKTLPRIALLKSYDAQGNEHKVKYRGEIVEKHQRACVYTIILSPQAKFIVTAALPSEYLRRLQLQNDLFGDSIRIIGVTPGDKFAITQKLIKGPDPGKAAITALMGEAGWITVPMHLQDLPHKLMGTAWWHPEEEVIAVDAREPNFKLTDEEPVPIDLILKDLTPAMRELLRASAPREAK